MIQCKQCRHKWPFDMHHKCERYKLDKDGHCVNCAPHPLPKVNKISYFFCDWKEPNWEDEDFYETDCGQSYCFEYETRNLSENGYNYCPKCGRKIRIVEHKEEENEE
jgi:hypothetical protein